jgi:hypothetical protein
MPFAALNLATRNPLLPIATRLSLFSLAFDVPFDYIQRYPNTSEGSSISERTTPRCPKKTFRPVILGKRACSLCIGLLVDQ